MAERPPAGAGSNAGVAYGPERAGDGPDGAVNRRLDGVEVAAPFADSPTGGIAR